MAKAKSTAEATAPKKNETENTAVETKNKAAAKTAKTVIEEVPVVKVEETVKKPAAKKAPATKKAAPKKVAPKKEAPKKAAPAKVNFCVEFNGKQVSVDEVIDNIKLTYGKDAKEISVYLKPQENKAYFVADGEEKEMDVFFC